jgi:hypothetical protein
MSDLARSSLRWQAPRCSRGRWILAALVGGLLGCAGPPPRTANPTRPLDERRAVEIIIRAFHEERDRPVPGRKIELTADKRLEVDVAAQGKKYGVAYVSLNERMTLGSALPPRDPAMGDALQLVRGLGPEADARILVLHDSEYQYDDQLGTERTVTSITAERKLERDVRDFLVRAHAERWP